MLFTHESNAVGKASYELKVDVSRGIVFEVLKGLWQPEDFKKYDETYRNEIVPLFKGKKWAKCSDLCDYKTSPVVGQQANAHLEWCFKNNIGAGAIIVSSALVKMQMNNAAKGSGVNPTAFTSLKEADEWLKTVGF